VVVLYLLRTGCYGKRSTRRRDPFWRNVFCYIIAAASKKRLSSKTVEPYYFSYHNAWCRDSFIYTDHRPMAYCYVKNVPGYVLPRILCETPLPALCQFTRLRAQRTVLFLFTDAFMGINAMAYPVFVPSEKNPKRV
jgi:hypothetical protein